ncbi:MAG: glycosyltransferase [Acutalibacteraceae bacterium]|jgi:glycosyltransferase involved in cell wall biosynthesis
MIKVLIFIESLELGGAERALALLAENIDKTKCDLHVVSVTDGQAFTRRVKEACRFSCFTKKPVSKHAKFKMLLNKLVIKFSCTAPPPLVHRVFFRERYDIEVAFCEGYAARLIAASPDKKSKKIAWIHTDVINNPWSEKIHGSAEKERACYNKFDAVCCVSDSVLNSAVQKFKIEQKALVVYNPTDEHGIAEHLKQSGGSDCKNDNIIRIVTAGRLVPVKVFDRLIGIAGRLKKEGFDFSLQILGEGEERPKLENMASQCGVADSVLMPGKVENPYPYYSRADFYVCSSKAEGLSMAATEAVMLGLPVITTDCAGMRELFGGFDCGLICENDEESLYAAIRYVFENPSCLPEFSNNCLERARDFSLAKNIKAVQRVFENVLEI